MTSLTFYGGAGEIGGNKILLEDKGAKMYLGFWREFKNKLNQPLKELMN